VTGVCLGGGKWFGFCDCFTIGPMLFKDPPGTNLSPLRPDAHSTAFFTGSKIYMRPYMPRFGSLCFSILLI
jgi:hypothetical protein